MTPNPYYDGDYRARAVDGKIPRDLTDDQIVAMIRLRAHRWRDLETEKAALKDDLAELLRDVWSHRPDISIDAFTKGDDPVFPFNAKTVRRLIWGQTHRPVGPTEGT